ncbi:MAG: LamG domain-containing protein [Gemmatimonadota bacterium]|nr:MAG: LamG domain-containing protein [Gemmatimonadota bacterium]
MRYLIRLLGICLLVLIWFYACYEVDSEGCESGWGWDGSNGTDGPYGPSDPCSGVVCPPDDNECTREYCSGGSCRSEPVTNGRSCTYDGLSGVCVNGVCGENLCEDVVCDEEPCSEGVCNYVDGSCSYTQNRPDGTPCVFDGNEGVCVDGVCGENLCEYVDCDDGDACTDGTCDYRDGTCVFTPVVCDDYETCTEDTCDPMDGCVFSVVEDGTECDGRFGMCEAGSCMAPCDLASDEEYQCPIIGLEDLFCCPGWEYCRGDCQVDPGGMVSYWRLDDGSGTTATDSVGDNDGTLFNGPTWISGQVGGALYFDGLDDYVEIPLLYSTSPSSLSISAWINPSLSDIGCVFYHGDNGEFNISATPSSLASFGVKLANGSWYHALSPPMTPGVWHHLVGVWTKGDSLRMYVDGELAGATEIPDYNLYDPGSSFLPSIGVYNKVHEPDAFYSGAIDEVAFYNRALTTEEIQDHYENGLDGFGL